ncbi:diaminobutyrate acetyltransferase [Arcobacter sp. FWKO B]|uniref:diaminobutyrate acetyltransferase n=1 Tax=Arcobacter sp. FWKO B TaxID=2593672 RepID=UPI0018A4EA52|nr:diaminobutyrate acetyltransferase [Arcobacter sp. FWKO B]QOG13148.1 diaminobutyrate acetyltransferase [Arcobacter sp. FWKO B]
MNEDIQLVNPTKGDAKSIYNLIKNSKPLDLNSQYLYLLQTTYFSDTCLIAKHNYKVIGFVSGFIHPKDENIFFVWQVAVDSSYRGQNIAFKMLKELFSKDTLSNIKYIHTTISPSNIASQKVFEKFANEFEFDKEISIFATKEDFDDAHEDELLYMMKPKVNIIKGL